MFTGAPVGRRKKKKSAKLRVSDITFDFPVKWHDKLLLRMYMYVGIDDIIPAYILDSQNHVTIGTDK